MARLIFYVDETKFIILKKKKHNQTRALLNKGICLVGIFYFWDFQNDQFKTLLNPNKKTMIGIITWTWMTFNEIKN
jgi:hypothetical protein